MPTKLQAVESDSPQTVGRSVDRFVPGVDHLAMALKQDRSHGDDTEFSLNRMLADNPELLQQLRQLVHNRGLADAAFVEGALQAGALVYELLNLQAIAEHDLQRRLMGCGADGNTVQWELPPLLVEVFTDIRVHPEVDVWLRQLLNDCESMLKLFVDTLALALYYADAIPETFAELRSSLETAQQRLQNHIDLVDPTP